MDDPLVWVRAVHFGSTLLVSGVVFFLIFVAEPAFRKAAGNANVPAIVRSRLAWLAWIGLIVVLISGTAWLVVVAARMVDLPLVETLSNAALWTAVIQTDFGRDWMVRLVLAVFLAAALSRLHLTNLIVFHWKGLVVLFLAAGLVGTLAWAGHAATGTGFDGTVHLSADVLHLIAAAAWVGALVPLTLLLGAAARNCDEFSAAIAGDAVLRFSTLGIISVAILIATGIINTLMLVGSMAGLVGTDYGRLLLLKIALFCVMLAVAGVNRIVLTARLSRAQGSAQYLLRQLRINSVIEATIGMIILVIVGALGTLPPGIQEHAASLR